MPVVVLLSASVLLQFTAAGLALRLIRVTGRRWAWVLIATALTLMAVRRSITLLRLVSGDTSVPPDLWAEMVALMISIIMLVGVARIAPLFLSIRRSQEEAHKLNRALKAFSECNQAVVRAADQVGLLQDVCRIIVDLGGYRLAWVGFVEHDQEKTVLPVAQAGFEEGYLDTLHITWADTERGRGPTGTAIRTGKPCMSRNVRTDPQYEPWRAEAVKRGYASSMALPLAANGRVFGALNVYAREPNAFDADEIDLLSDLAADLAYGITTLRTRSERARAEQEKRVLEEQLHQSQKMEAIGELAAGVTHDFNNFLTVILGNAERLRSLLPTDHQAREGLDLIGQAAEQAAEVTRSLLTFSEKLPTQKKPVDLCSVVEQSGRLFRHILPRRIELTVQTQDAPLWVNADATQMQQVLLNLALNARDAMPNGGTLEVAVSAALEADVPESVKGSSSGMGFARVRVVDTGVGMPPELQSRIFEPFFTTKPRGKGTGLGLAMVHGIVRSHDGHIAVESQTGVGTTCTLVFPCIAPGQDTDPPAQQASAGSRAAP